LSVAVFDFARLPLFWRSPISMTNHSFKPFQSELTFRLLDRANVA